MNFPYEINTTDEIIQVRIAHPDDLPGILALFDASVEWLVQRGITGQWGIKPFSQNPKSHDRFMKWIDSGTMFVAESHSIMVGTLAVTKSVPEYVVEAVKDFPGSASYLEAFTTSRAKVGHGIGSALLKWAEEYSREQGSDYFRLDCWGDNPALCGYYENNGFTRCGNFLVGQWRGQLFEKRIN